MDAASMLRSVGSLGAVLGLLLIALWATRRYNLRLPGAPVASGTRRLAVVERVALDARRSIALIRRDGREHLILVSPEGHQVVERNIAAPVPAAPAPNFAAALAAASTGPGAATPTQDLATLIRVIAARLRPLAAIARRGAQAAARSRDVIQPLAAPILTRARTMMSMRTPQAPAAAAPVAVAAPRSTPRARPNRRARRAAKRSASRG